MGFARLADCLKDILIRHDRNDGLIRELFPRLNQVDYFVEPTEAERMSYNSRAAAVLVNTEVTAMNGYDDPGWKRDYGKQHTCAS